MRAHEFIADRTRYRLSLGDPQAATESLERVRPHEAERLVREWAGSPHTATLHALTEFTGRSAAELAWELSHPTPSVVLFREPDEHAAVDTRPRQVTDLVPRVDEPEPEPIAPEPDDHWIEVRLLDEADRAIVGERYELALPSGKIQAGRTDELGIVRVDRILNPGNCEIYFPDLDARVAAG